MNRRRFMALSAGAAALSVPALGQQCVSAAPCSGLWSGSLATEGANLPSIDPPNPIAAMPPAEAVRCCNFAGNAPPGSAVGFQRIKRPRMLRRRWSTIDPANAEDRQLLADLHTAYCKLRALPDDDPRSLIRQAWLHDFYCGAWKDGDLHNTWGFLPWHRAFVYFHELILAKLLGKPHFRLPAWDWDRRGRVPGFFLKLGLPTFLRDTAGRLTPGPGGSWANRCVLQAWLLSDNYQSFVGVSPGSGPPGQAFIGPHGMAHAFVGGAMRISPTAAADPVFCAHHANVDRFWAYWQNHYHFKPTDGWGAQEFFLYDDQCRLVRVRADDLFDETLLGYHYEKPDVPLCAFEPLTITEDLLFNAFQLGLNFRTLSLGALISMGNSAALKIGEFFAQPSIRFSDLLNPACFESFPVRTSLSLATHDLKPGQYYLVMLRRGSDLYSVGGFGLFGSPTHLMMEDSVRMVATGCIDPKLYQTLLAGPAGLKLVYGESNQGALPRLEDTRPVASGWNLDILHPAGYLQTGRNWLSHFGLV